MRTSRDIELNHILSLSDATKRYITSLQGIICDTECSDVDFYRVAGLLMNISNETLSTALSSIIKERKEL